MGPCSCELLLPSGIGLCNKLFMGLGDVPVGICSSDFDIFATRNSGGATYKLIEVNIILMGQRVDACFGNGMDASH